MRKSLSRNHYFVLGFLVGLILSFYIPENAWELVRDECPEATESLADKFGEDFEPHLNLINKPLAAKKPVKNVIRPRYYSSELGIREKIFIGVMTTQDNINTLATAFNRTSAHLVNKIKFFINADNVKSNFKLKNIVGFTDTRENLRPFHILKYIADNYLDEYDYFYIVPDTVYVDARRLKTLLYHISSTFDVYMGRRCDNVDLDGFGIENDRNYCDLDAGILLSSSVIRKIRSNLDWCVRNAVTNFHSVNIGKCVKYSSKIVECQDQFQAVKIPSYKLENTKLFKDLNVLTREANFRDAVILYPVTNVDDFYTLHAHFSRINLDSLKNQSLLLERNTYGISNGTVSNNILEIRWPLGVPTASKPETRHDLLPWNYINLTHIFMPNYKSVVTPLSRIDYEDFRKILNKSLTYAKYKYPDLKFDTLHTAYKRFDPTRGMDYQLHLQFIDTKKNQAEIKSFEVVKPLGRVEIVPSPYVTESTRVAILLPIFEHQVSESLEFVKRYERICMENQDNTFLMMIFLYGLDSPSKGNEDKFNDLKNLALELSKKFKADGSRIAWVSIRLPAIYSQRPEADDIMINSMYGKNQILSLAVIDLALRKIGLDSLVMLGSNSMSIKADFLNRVRMNTIQGFQIYSPIGFMMYPCNFAHFCKECDNCDVSQAAGYFDSTNYDVVSFYSRDYVEARKKLESIIPIVRNDNDIDSLQHRSDKNINNVLDMFVAAQLPVHILRAVEPNLRFGEAIRRYFENKDAMIPKCPLHEFNGDDSLRRTNENCIHLASRKQIGDAIIRFRDKISDTVN